MSCQTGDKQGRFDSAKYSEALHAASVSAVKEYPKHPWDRWEFLKIRGTLLEAPTGRKRAKNAFSPKPFGTGLRGTNSTLGPVEGSKMLLPPRMA